jgi:hypothetical protein
MSIFIARKGDFPMSKYLTLILAFLIILTMSSTIFAGSVERSRTESADCHLALGFGTFEGWYEDPFLTIGIDVDTYISEKIMITLDLWTFGAKPNKDDSLFSFIQGMINLGSTINYKIGNPDNQFFAGAGVTFSIPWVEYDQLFSLKLNAGIMTEDIKLTFYLLTPFENLFEKDNVAFGANIGFTL